MLLTTRWCCQWSLEVFSRASGTERICVEDDEGRYPSIFAHLFVSLVLKTSPMVFKLIQGMFPQTGTQFVHFRADVAPHGAIFFMGVRSSQELIMFSLPKFRTFRGVRFFSPLHAMFLFFACSRQGFDEASLDYSAGFHLDSLHLDRSGFSAFDLSVFPPASSFRRTTLHI